MTVSKDIAQAGFVGSGGVGAGYAVDFTASDTQPAPDDTITFTPNITGGTPDFYHWDFGDGSTSNLSNPTHSYSSEGYKTVRLTVSGADGGGSKERANYINVYTPVADLNGTFDHLWLPVTAISYADSLLDKSTKTGGKDLSEVNGGPNDWTSGSGWQFVAADDSALDTGLQPGAPANHADWTIMVQFEDFNADNTYYLLGVTGAYSGGYREQIYMSPEHGFGGWKVAHGSAPYDPASPDPMPSGNLCFVGTSVYKDGTYQGETTNAGTNTVGILYNLYIGALNDYSTLKQTMQGTIKAVGIRTSTLTAQQVSDMAAAMAAL
jgi:PKD repeat protein